MDWGIFFLGVIMLLPIVTGGLTFIVSAQETEKIRQQHNMDRNKDS